MSRHTTSCLLVLSGLCAACPGEPQVGLGGPGAAAALPAEATPEMGVNLNRATYYSPAWVFVDLFKLSRHGSNSPWRFVQGEQLATPELDEAGYPKGLAEGQVVATLCGGRGIEGHYPAGEYVVLFEGDGCVELSGDGEARFDHDGRGTARFTAQVDPSDRGLEVRIRRSDPQNHVRGVRVIMPGFESSYADQPFHPLFLERLRGFRVLRFMDWGHTNDSTLRRWSERPLPGYRTQSQHDGKGVAYEWMLALAEAVGADPWLCVPHGADDDFVRQLGALVREQLEPERRIYLELSNEVWNPGFEQHAAMKEEAERAGETLQARYAKRAKEVFALFADGLGDAERVVRVLATQMANPSLTRRILEHVEPGDADVLALGCYVGGGLGGEEVASQLDALSDERLFELLREDLAQRRAYLQTARQQAAEKGLQVVAYEGGQHLAAKGRFKGEPAIDARFDALNRDPRMGEVYRELFAMWAGEGAGLFCHYGFCYLPTKHGRWGLLEYMDQPVEEAPKFAETARTAAAWHGTD